MERLGPILSLDSLRSDRARPQRSSELRLRMFMRIGARRRSWQECRPDGRRF